MREAWFADPQIVIGLSGAEQIHHILRVNMTCIEICKKITGSTPAYLNYFILHVHVSVCIKDSSVNKSKTFILIVFFFFYCNNLNVFSTSVFQQLLITVPSLFREFVKMHLMNMK